MSSALEIAHKAISNYYRRKAKFTANRAKTGAVTLIQRFGGSLNVNIHFHQLFVDGTYELDPEGKPTDFWTSGTATITEISSILETIIKRLLRYLENQKLLSKMKIWVFNSLLQKRMSFPNCNADPLPIDLLLGKVKGKRPWF